MTDAVLRNELREHRSWTAESRRLAARAAFAYYRWRGWLAARDEVTQQVIFAFDLNNKYNNNHYIIPETELRRRVVPAWVNDCLTVSDAWLRSLQREPRLWLRVRPGGADAVTAALGREWLRPHAILRDCWEYQGTADLYRSPAFLAGQFEIQDIASQVVGELCHPEAGEVWWDACAGEGGKTILLADKMRNRGLLWASDCADWRLKKLRRRAARARVFNYRSRFWDGTRRLPTQTQFDGVLVDAPCSGLGTWQRNPQARWTLEPAEVRELATRQAGLLEQAAKAVKPGGRLVYSVCTMTRAETVEVAEAFQRAHPQFVELTAGSPLDPRLGPIHQHWFWPQTSGGNGMFAALWKRRGG